MTFDPRRALRRRLETLIARALGEPTPAPELGVDDEDLAAQTLELDAIAGDRARVLAQIRAIRAAFLRLDHGTYGRCLDCGGVIPRPRLEAIPWTETCVGCQTAREAMEPRAVVRIADVEDDD